MLSSGPVPDPVEVTTAYGELYGYSGMLVRVPGPLEVTRTGAYPWAGWTFGSGPLRLITLGYEPTDVSVGTTFSSVTGTVKLYLTLEAFLVPRSAQDLPRPPS